MTILASRVEGDVLISHPTSTRQPEAKERRKDDHGCPVHGIEAKKSVSGAVPGQTSPSHRAVRSRLHRITVRLEATTRCEMKRSTSSRRNRTTHRRCPARIRTLGRTLL